MCVVCMLCVLCCVVCVCVLCECLYVWCVYTYIYICVGDVCLYLYIYMCVVCRQSERQRACSSYKVLCVLEVYHVLFVCLVLCVVL